MTQAVVFAYHDVGVRCLRALLAHRVAVSLVVTHEDDPAEKVWFESVAQACEEHELPAIAPEDANSEPVRARVAACRPDFIFSFYYRRMLGAPLLACASRGALNMHGSLLPRYRGRAPVNWAVVRGERETGATLHYMADKPDAGDIVDQQAVPILPDDRAVDVMRKIAVAAELVMHRTLPALVAGTAPRRPQDLAQGSYFGARKPEDGRVDWSADALTVHNLVRGVAPPYPGALTTFAGRKARVLRSALCEGVTGPHAGPTLFVQGGRCYAQCGDRRLLRIVELEIEGRELRGPALVSALGDRPIALTGETLRA
jgi:methionyl-tRNA formyltransferase